MRVGATLVVAVVVLFSVASLAAPSKGVLVVRTKGAQIDEAVGALKAELGSVPIVDELAADDSVDAAAAAIQTRVSNADVVVAVGARAAQAALKQSKLPVVHCMVLQDAQSLDGDNSAGVPLAVPAKAQLAALAKVAPKAKRVGVLYDPKLNARFVDDAKAASKSAGVTIVAKAVDTATAAPAALDEIIDSIDALLVPPDATVVTKELITFLVARAFTKKLPVLGFSESLARVGTMAALAPSYAQNGKLCAALAKKVLAGEKPAALHGALSMSGTLYVNVATARRIGIDVPASVLAPPTQVVGQ